MPRRERGRSWCDLVAGENGAWMRESHAWVILSGVEPPAGVLRVHAGNTRLRGACRRWYALGGQRACGDTGPGPSRVWVSDKRGAPGLTLPAQRRSGVLEQSPASGVEVGSTQGDGEHDGEQHQKGQRGGPQEPVHACVLRSAMVCDERRAMFVHINTMFANIGLRQPSESVVYAQ